MPKQHVLSSNPAKCVSSERQTIWESNWRDKSSRGNTRVRPVRICSQRIDFHLSRIATVLGVVRRTCATNWWKHRKDFCSMLHLISDQALCNTRTETTYMYPSNEQPWWGREKNGRSSLQAWETSTFARLRCFRFGPQTIACESEILHFKICCVHENDFSARYLFCKGIVCVMSWRPPLIVYSGQTMLQTARCPLFDLGASLLTELHQYVWTFSKAAHSDMSKTECIWIFVYSCKLNWLLRMPWCATQFRAIVFGLCRGKEIPSRACPKKTIKGLHCSLFHQKCCWSRCLWTWKCWNVAESTDQTQKHHSRSQGSGERFQPEQPFYARNQSFVCRTDKVLTSSLWYPHFRLLNSATLVSMEVAFNPLFIFAQEKKANTIWTWWEMYRLLTNLWSKCGRRPSSITEAQEVSWES